MILKELIVNGITRITGNLIANDIYGDLNGVAAAAKCDHLGNVIDTYYQPKLGSGLSIKYVGGKSILGSGNLSSLECDSGISKFTLTEVGMYLKINEIGSSSQLQLVDTPTSSARTDYHTKIKDYYVVKVEAITNNDLKFQFSMATDAYAGTTGPGVTVDYFSIEGLHANAAISYNIKELNVYYCNRL